MLLQFTVENYKSIKDRAVLSMEPSSDKEHPENMSNLNTDKVLNAVSVFGANASGKSNLFDALRAAVSVITSSVSRQPADEIKEIIPFKFRAHSNEFPSFFEFVFIDDGKKHVYGFSATNRTVLKEYLYVYNTQRPTTIFERENDSYRFTSAESKRIFQPIAERTTSNKLFLTTATLWNCEATRAAYTWFTQKLNIYSSDYANLYPYAVGEYVDDNGPALRDFTTQLLERADINIQDYKVISRKKVHTDYLQQFPSPLDGSLSSSERDYSVEITTIHKVEKADSEEVYSLLLQEESQGTQYLFMLAPILKRAFENGETLCIDEFDSGIHPLLVRYIYNLFNNPMINTGHAQLIVSTHATILMSLKDFRRDQIYFVEKNSETGASELYALDNFSPRKGEDIAKAYLLGRYGSVPIIWEDD